MVESPVRSNRTVAAPLPVDAEETFPLLIFCGAWCAVPVPANSLSNDDLNRRVDAAASRNRVPARIDP